MVKFISQLLGAKVLLYQEKLIVGEVNRVLIDSNDGTFVGFAVLPTHQKELTYIPVSEIKGYGQGFLLVEGISSLSEEDDVIKIKSVLEREPQIIGSTVFTESGQRIGKVEDATLDVKFSVLKKLYVGSIFPLNILTQQKIIDRKQIVKIEKNKIIVKDTTISNKNKIPLSVKTPMSELNPE